MTQHRRDRENSGNAIETKDHSHGKSLTLRAHGTKDPALANTKGVPAGCSLEPQRQRSRSLRGGRLGVTTISAPDVPSTAKL